MKKEIKINLVGSNRFYKNNQIFFTVAVFFKLFEAVSYNSLSSIPGLFMVIGLMSLYEIRKKYSRMYRTYSFVVLYWVQFMMIVKLVVELYVSIESVNANLHIQAMDSDNVAATLLQCLFGRLHTMEDIRDRKHINFASQYWIFSILISIYCCQGWKTCKWFEIRDKTSDLGFTYLSLTRFWNYIKVRE